MCKSIFQLIINQNFTACNIALKVLTVVSFVIVIVDLEVLKKTFQDYF
jgi:hypothetical protein